MLAEFAESVAAGFQDTVALFADNYDPLRDTVEILIVSALIYAILILLRGTRATQVLIGVLALAAFRFLSAWFEFRTLIWLFDNFFAFFPVILAILFADDIRRALARIGRGVVPHLTTRQEGALLEEIVRACQTLSRRRVGALIAIERESALAEHVQGGQPVDAALSKELLAALFMQSSPLHDGAVLIERGRVARAGAILPLSARADLPEEFGTRHRAAIGITELTDAVVVVVSEETGMISAVQNGELNHGLEAPQLRVALLEYLARESADAETMEAEAEYENDPDYQGEGQVEGQFQEEEQGREGPPRSTAP